LKSLETIASERKNRQQRFNKASTATAGGKYKFMTLTHFNINISRIVEEAVNCREQCGWTEAGYQ